MQLIDVGSAIGVYPQNLPEDVQTVIRAFGWQADELLGNMTVEELLSSQIDIRSKKISKQKILTQATNLEEAGPLIDSLIAEDRKYTLLELAQKLERDQALIRLPSFLLEGDFTKVQKRFYSIVNDPFSSPEANTVKLLFGRHKFLDSHGQETAGHCT